MRNRFFIVPLAAAISAIASTAQADLIIFTATLSGPAESPPNASPGTGSGQVGWDTIANTMRVQATFSGLMGTTTASHIHAATVNPGVGTAGVATQTPSFSGFPLGVTAGVMDTTFDMTLASSYNPSFITANGGSPATAQVALFNALSTGRAYFNIHSQTFPGGEIRGFLVPAPANAMLLGLGGLLAIRRRR